MAAFTPNPKVPLDGLPNGCQVVASGAYTATATAEFAVPSEATMVEAHFTQSSGTSGQSLVLSLEAYNPVADTWESLISSAALTQATTDDAYVQVNPFTPAVTNKSAQRVVRRRMRVKVAHADTKSATYAVDVHVS